MAEVKEEEDILSFRRYNPTTTDHEARLEATGFDRSVFMTLEMRSDSTDEPRYGHHQCEEEVYNS